MLIYEQVCDKVQLTNNPMEYINLIFSRCSIYYRVVIPRKKKVINLQQLHGVIQFRLLVKEDHQCLAGPQV